MQLQLQLRLQLRLQSVDCLAMKRCFSVFEKLSDF